MQNMLRQGVMLIWSTHRLLSIKQLSASRAPISCKLFTYVFYHLWCSILSRELHGAKTEKALDPIFRICQIKS